MSRRPLRVLLVQDTYLPQLGGAEVHVANLARHLAGRGHRVTVLTASPGGAEGTPPGGRVVRWPELTSGGKRAWAGAAHRLPALVRLVAGHDVVHAHYSFFMAALLAAVTWRRPFVVTLHGLGTLDSSVGSSRLLRAYRRVSIRRAGAVLATSTEMAGVARRFAVPGRVHVVPNAVDVPADPPGGADPGAVVTVRRLVPKNGVQYLVEALPLIVEQAPSAHLTVVGGGPMAATLEARASELGVAAGRITFTGPLDNDAALAVVDRCAVAVFPSSAESTSIAALEAMARAKPIVASAVGGYPEMIGGDERGLLVALFDRTASDYEAPDTLPADRIAALADAVARVLSDEALAARLGAAAREWVARTCAWPVVVDQVEEAYRRAAKKPSSRAAASAARTPRTTTGSWFRRGSAHRL